MVCQKCQSKRSASVQGKTSDLCCFYVSSNDIELNDYVPSGVGIGGGDYIEFTYCLDCGQIQGNFPISSEVITKLKK